MLQLGNEETLANLIENNGNENQNQKVPNRESNLGNRGTNQSKADNHDANFMTHKPKFDSISYKFFTDTQVELENQKHSLQN